MATEDPATLIQPTPSTAGRRRELRRLVRQLMGVSSDPPPLPRQTVAAVEVLSELVEQTTGGRFGVALIDLKRGEFADVEATLREIREGQRA